MEEDLKHHGNPDNERCAGLRNSILDQVYLKRGGEDQERSYEGAQFSLALATNKLSWSVSVIKGSDLQTQVSCTKFSASYCPDLLLDDP